MITVAELKKLKESKLINLTQVCKLAGLDYSSIIQKIRRNSELRVNESEAIENVLNQIKGR